MKEKRSLGNPDAPSAVTAAHGPGKGTMRAPASAACCTTWKPGSLTSGVPASLISATLFPAVMRSTNHGARVRSLWS